MTKRTVLIVAAAMFGYLAGAGPGCDSIDAREVCESTCDKEQECFAQAASPCKATRCPSANDELAGCSNRSKILNAAKDCIAGTCAAYSACVAALPTCQIGGTGGSSGGGTGGSGGDQPSCAPCTKVDSCCAAALGSANCGASFATQCNALTGADRTTVIAQCNSTVATFRQAYPSIAACQ